jgi:hypothetical protein
MRFVGAGGEHGMLLAKAQETVKALHASLLSKTVPVMTS